MRVVIRADASRTIGTGHIHRCLALTHVLEQAGAEVVFVTRNLGLDVSRLLGGRPLLLLPSPDGGSVVDRTIPHAAWAGVDQARDAAETLAALSGAAVPVGSADWFVIDHYAFGALWHDAVRSATRARILAIDDLADRHLNADVVVDHNYWAGGGGKYDMVAPAAMALVGPRYALLGPAYSDAPRYAFAERVRSVGIFMGGVDAAGATALVLDAMADLGPDIEVATTSANPHLADLHDRGAQVSVDQPNLAAFFARHDLQIGAGGGASWERCCIGAPTLLLVMADNQRAVAGPLAAIGAVATTGSDFPADRAGIRAVIRRLIETPEERLNLSERSRRLVDGRGAARIAEVMI